MSQKSIQLAANQLALIDGICVSLDPAQELHSQGLTNGLIANRDKILASLAC